MENFCIDGQMGNQRDRPIRQIRSTDQSDPITGRAVLFYTPIYEEYKDFSKRQKSFSSWSIYHCQDPSKLATAGFFYSGRGDETICFHCGVCICEWERDDDPYLEHSRWSPFCHFMMSETSVNYIQDSLRSKPPKYNCCIRNRNRKTKI